MFLLRFHMVLILCGMLAASLLLDRMLLWLDVDAMLIRYPLNVIAGYATFFVFIRLWLFYIHRLCAAQIEQIEFPEPGVKGETCEKGGSWSEYSEILNIGMPVEGGCLVTILIFILLGFFIGGLVLIIEAPLFLSDVAALFFLAGSLARPMHRMDNPHWVGSVFGQTWKWFLLALVSACLLALFANVVCPDARTMADVIKELMR
jgi:ribose/xylose/arabinose/galactoside ABC-type transport system permease subunit